MTEYNFIKKGGLHKEHITQTGHKIKLPCNEYYISVETDNKDFHDFMDAEISKLIQKFQRG